MPVSWILSASALGEGGGGILVLWHYDLRVPCDVSLPCSDTCNQSIRLSEYCLINGTLIYLLYRYVIRSTIIALFQ